LLYSLPATAESSHVNAEPRLPWLLAGGPERISGAIDTA
jgi:hypothetical protein